ncbi:uncharacterized protein LOC131250790 isoform X2 [Magnolia sinica]|uniref:uncharacterized protein LOC131250790 isoform X2 n=1 Tax=Magnolia sinica TaxID=86752 RepID=UPI00265AF3C9|nr:uncharacterized protein LOC131250790 isoform X2 [Magnolia sinica]
MIHMIMVMEMICGVKMVPFILFPMMALVKHLIWTGSGRGGTTNSTHALALLPDHLKEKMEGELEMRERLQNLYESVHSISTKDALQWFHDDILGSGSEQPHNHLEGNADVATMPDDISRCNQLERFSKELESLLRECPSIEVHPAVDRKTVI